MIKAIIFDCFGVIISDGLEIFGRTLEQTDPEARAFIGETIRLNNLGVIEPAESNRRIAERLHMTLEEWRNQIDQGEVRDEALLQWIQSLRKKYKTAMLSNIGRASIERRFSEDELAACFDVVVISGDLGIAKPDPAIYKHTAKQLDVDPDECVFIDDREVYCSGAREVGMKAIVYESLPQLRAELKIILQKG